MFNKKCSGCAKKIEKAFNFCPYCGNSVKEGNVREDFGLLGIEDSGNPFDNQIKMPSGMEKMINSLVKQLEKQMTDQNFTSGSILPKGFNIKISTGKPQIINQVIEEPRIKEEIIRIPQEEMNRRMNLPKIEAESKVKRIGDKIIYEINAPGISEKRDVMITKLATGVEIRAYAKNQCYTKIIPLKVEVLAYQVKDEKIFIELKG